LFPLHLDLSFLGLKIIYHFESIYFIIAIVCGILIARRRMKNAGLELTKDQSDEILYVALLAGLIGTRLSHFLFWSIREFLKNPLIAVTPGVTGASIVGGLIFGIAAGYIYARIKKYDFYSIFAAVSPALLIAQSVGRIGCFLNGDAFGTAAPKFLGVRFARFGYTIPTLKKITAVSSPAWSYSNYNNLNGITETKSGYLYPTQLYEILANMLLLFFIFLVLKKMKNKADAARYVFFIHAGGYALSRAFLQFIRVDRGELLAGNISILQAVLFLISLFFIITSVRTLIFKKSISGE
jgi:phosphatidylglycerol---prolipoprotein diacylglyceryl transferase